MNKNECGKELPPDSSFALDALSASLNNQDPHWFIHLKKCFFITENSILPSPVQGPPYLLKLDFCVYWIEQLSCSLGICYGVKNSLFFFFFSFTVVSLRDWGSVATFHSVQGYETSGQLEHQQYYVSACEVKAGVCQASVTPLHPSLGPVDNVTVGP